MLKFFLKKSKEGFILQVKLVPRSKKLGIISHDNQILKIGVSSPPLDNKANDELIKFISKELKIAKSKIVIISGECNRNKVLLVDFE